MSARHASDNRGDVNVHVLLSVDRERKSVTNQRFPWLQRRLLRTISPATDSTQLSPANSQAVPPLHHLTHIAQRLAALTWHIWQDREHSLPDAFLHARAFRKGLALARSLCVALPGGLDSLHSTEADLPFTHQPSISKQSLVQCWYPSAPFPAGGFY